MTVLFWYANRLPGFHQLGFPLDDTWIHLVYARNLWHSGYYAFNPGIATTGDTAPLWVLLLAPIYAITQHLGSKALILGVYALGALCQLLIIYFAWDVSLYLSKKRVVAIAVALTIAMSPILIFTVFGGMEVGLAAALMLAIISCYLRRRWWLVSLTLALVAVTRPEAAFIWLLFCGIILFTRQHATGLRNKLKLCAKITIFPLILGLAWFTYNYIVSQHIFPASFYFKEDINLLYLPIRFYKSIRYVILDTPPFIAGIGLIVLLAYWKLRDVVNKIDYCLPLIISIIFLIVNVSLVSSLTHTFYYARYLIPAIPMLILASYLGVHQLSLRLFAGKLNLLWCFFGLAILESAVMFYPLSNALHKNIYVINTGQVAMAKWIAKHIPKSEWVAASDVGAVGYFSQHNTIDLAGLNTPNFFWHAKSYRKEHPISVFTLLHGAYRVDKEHAVLVKHFLYGSKKIVFTWAIVAEQIIVGCKGKPNQLVNIHVNRRKNSVSFIRPFNLYCRVPQHAWPQAKKPV